MPTYEYRCLTCSEEFEIFQSFTENTLAKCPAKSKGVSPGGCVSPGRGKVEKLFSAPAIIFKGQGFYKTDSKVGASSASNSSRENASRENASDKKSPDKKNTDKKNADKNSSTSSAGEKSDSGKTSSAKDSGRSSGGSSALSSKSKTASAADK